MASRRTKVLWFVGVVATAASVIAIAWALRPARPGVFRLREARSYIIPRRLPPSMVSGDRQVEADFEYVGPTLSPRVGAVRRILMGIGALSRPPTVQWRVQDIVFLDEAGQELARLPVIRSTTRPSAHPGFMEAPEKRQLVQLWTFDLPPGVDRSKPVTFRTRLGVNEHPPVVIEVKLPAMPRPDGEAASQPATSPADSSVNR